MSEGQKSSWFIADITFWDLRLTSKILYIYISYVAYRCCLLCWNTITHLLWFPRLQTSGELQTFYYFAFLMCVVVMAFQIPSSTLFHSLLHSKHPIVSSQKRNRYTHSLKDTCRGTWRSKVSKCKEERLWFFYQKLFQKFLRYKSHH